MTIAGRSYKYSPNSTDSYRCVLVSELFTAHTVGYNVFDRDPVLHPDDRPEPDEDGPWLSILALALCGWVLLVALDRTLLVEGTFLWATVRIGYTLICAPLIAAALLQDSRALATDGIKIGRSIWLYAIASLVFAPVSIAYLGHRHYLVVRSIGTA